MDAPVFGNATPSSLTTSDTVACSETGAKAASMQIWRALVAKVIMCLQFITSLEPNKTLILCCCAFLLLVVVVPYFTFKIFRKSSQKASCVLSDSLQIAIGQFSAIGKRPTMEDAILVKTNLQYNAYMLERQINSHVAVVGVFDGHCGKEIAMLAAERLPSFLESNEDLFSLNPVQVSKALSKTFLDFDASTNEMPSGSTALLAVMTPQNLLFVANAGDSRAILIENFRPIRMSEDHKPSRESEKKRIERAGGQVHPTTVNQYGCLLQLGPSRVWPGGLSVSRGFGDHGLKDLDKLLKIPSFAPQNHLPLQQRQLISAYPEVRRIQITPQTQALVLACDGLYDVMTSADIAKVIQQHLPKMMVKAIEQVAIRSIDHEQDEATGDFFRKLLAGLQRSYARMKFSILHELEDHLLSSEHLQHADFLCAQMLSEKLVSIALQRESTDNVSVSVVIFRSKETRKTARQWRELFKDENIFTKFHKMLSRNSEVSVSDPSENDAREPTLWVDPQDPSLPWLEEPQNEEQQFRLGPSPTNVAAPIGKWFQ